MRQLTLLWNRFFCAYCDRHPPANHIPKTSQTPAPREDDEGSELRKVKRIYAELISDRGLPSNIPPIKVLINEKIALTAADQIKDSHVIAHELSKSLLLDFLHNPSSKNQFGQFLNDIFRYEYLLAPTRNLIYWSFTTPNVHYYIYDFTKYQTVQWFHYYAPSLCASLLCDYITYPENSQSTFIPSLQSLLRSEESIVQPLTDLVTSSLPDAKVSTPSSTLYCPLLVAIYYLPRKPRSRGSRSSSRTRCARRRPSKPVAPPCPPSSSSLTSLTTLPTELLLGTSYCRCCDALRRKRQRRPSRLGRRTATAERAGLLVLQPQLLQ